MKDRFIDLSKAIYDDNDFVEIETFINKLNLGTRGRQINKSEVKCDVTNLENLIIKDELTSDQIKDLVSNKISPYKTQPPKETISSFSESSKEGEIETVRLSFTSGSRITDHGYKLAYNRQEFELGNNQETILKNNSSADLRPLYVDGPLDGSPYAVINTLVKSKPLEDCPILVDQMKDLDRLINALVQEAESIEIPYHARPDSLPFSYTYPNSLTKNIQFQNGKSLTPNTSPQEKLFNCNKNQQEHPSLFLEADCSSNSYKQNLRPLFGQNSLVDELIIYPKVGAVSRSNSHQPIKSSSFVTYEKNHHLTPNNFQDLLTSSITGNETNGIEKRVRSQSLDGRCDLEKDEGPDQWLERQMKKLQAKRDNKATMKNEWLTELKTADRFLPHRSNNVVKCNDQQLYAYPTDSTPLSVLSEVRAPYSSDEDDDIEVDMEVFQRGRKIKRYHSESAYDRVDTSLSSTRAPSQLSYNDIPFPSCPPTPYTNRPDSPGKQPASPKASCQYFGASSEPIGFVDISTLNNMDRAQTPVNPRPIFMIDSQVKFAQDLSEFWYKPYASREETVATLMQAPQGYFIIRNSNSFPGAYGLAIKVSDTKGDKGIRHFLIEPTRFGARLRGCGNLEPVFSSLSAFVYAHSIESLALPINLTLPSYDILPSSQSQSTTAHLLLQGAACQLLFLGMVGVECLTGEEAIHRGVIEISAASPVPISLRLSRSGLTLTDVFRKQFFRIHFALNEISFASVVQGRSVAYGGREVKQVFGIVARAPRAHENSVIILAELEQGQPASAICSFILRVIAWQQN